ncbi:MAG TPA: YCF48-related protein [Thauera aminoaromatica]|nr:YCF48-related protein [Thauera aminoaromatica]HNO64394.1 YCF48-related protein [Thauera aminoaromatica]
MNAFSTPRRVRFFATCCAALCASLAPAAGDTSVPGAAAAAAAFVPRPAVRSAFAERSMILDATRAGPRLVAVGERGVVLLSDDDGAHWRQAGKVPVDATLTAVSFADAREGWAVGHLGVILHSADGGETWSVQRIDPVEDRPLFAVAFTDARNGVAVGLWSLMLRTRDGGRTWEAAELPPPPGDTRADANLMSVFGDGEGRLFIAGERGLVLRSLDGGATWSYHPTGYRGTFWSGTALADGTLIVGGLRGSVYRSTDNGEHWQRVETGSQSSVTDLVAFDGRVHAVGLDGVSLDSRDGGASFAVERRADRLSLTAAVATAGGVLHFSRAGLVR